MTPPRGKWAPSDPTPKSGWTCTGIEDLGEPDHICEMCEHEIVRYVHTMAHAAWHTLRTGCICAGRMEGDIAAARQRQTAAQQRAARRARWAAPSKWRATRNGNATRMHPNGARVVVCRAGAGYRWIIYGPNGSKHVGKVFPTERDARIGAWDAMQRP